MDGTSLVAKQQLPLAVGVTVVAAWGGASAISATFPCSICADAVCVIPLLKLVLLCPAASVLLQIGSHVCCCSWPSVVVSACPNFFVDQLQPCSG